MNVIAYVDARERTCPVMSAGRHQKELCEADGCMFWRFAITKPNIQLCQEAETVLAVDNDDQLNPERCGVCLLCPSVSLALNMAGPPTAGPFGR